MKIWLLEKVAEKFPIVNPLVLPAYNFCISYTIPVDSQEDFCLCEGGSDAAACCSTAVAMQSAAHFGHHIKPFAHGTQAHTHVLLTYCWFPSLLSSAFFFFFFFLFWTWMNRARAVWSGSAAASLLSLSHSRMCSVRPGASHTGLLQKI